MRFELLVRLAAMGVACGMNVLIAAGQVAIPTVTIGNPGNAPDPTTGYGSVAYVYNIGTTEVTNAQYAAFLNAKAASDLSGLYNSGMAGPFGGITRSGVVGSFTYATVTGRENNPVSFVSFWDATRFANWLHNGQGGGDTESGAYTLTSAGISANTVTRNVGWLWAVTVDNEWYKAACHQPASEGGDSDNYWLYPTSSNTINTLQANFGNMIGNTTPVGSYAANFYGAFDMGGNVWEWNESIIFGSNRGLRGGGFRSDDLSLRVGPRVVIDPTDEREGVGFRVSSSMCVPLVLLAGPADTSCCDADTVNLTVSVTGTSPQFQWRRNGMAVEGAITATFTISSVSLADAGSYDCVITNACGSVTGNPAVLTVRTPQILTPPASQTVNGDQPVFFALEADPASPCFAGLTYQWQRRNPLVEDDAAPNAWLDLSDGGGFAGTGSPILAILRPTPGLATGYRCKITNACGCEADANGVLYTNTVNFSAACPSDFNSDGSVDADDVIAFFYEWDRGRADFNMDGGADADDVIEFFARWDAGC